VVITQGYIAANRDGATVLLGRGGSDTSAALLAGRLGAASVEIWTDVPGFFSADPRLVPDARLLQELEFAEALEMAAGGAKVLHPRCISAAAASGTTIYIRDTGHPDLAGTRITQVAEPAAGVKNITCQKDMLVLLLQKIDIRREVGFLASVFATFRQRGISIDLVATSETTTTVALNRSANLLDEDSLLDLLADLRKYSTVEVFPDCVCVNLVGTAVRTVLSQLQSSMEYFRHRPLLMLSQSANDLCLSLLMPAGDHELLVRQLHQELVSQAQVSTGPKFGPSWRDLKNRKNVP
jgi:diaminopimelate decarboxylase/aspartate kinase